MLDARDVTVSFGEQVVLDRCSLHVDAGEVVALLGPSGSGKSTLLRAIAGIVVPEEGTVAIDGVDLTHVPTHRRSVGMVFQDEQLFPHLTVAGNIGFGLRMARVPRADRVRRVAVMLDLVGLPGFGDRRIDHLSGGEAKRVALARSLAPHPKVLLLDEPLTGLDRDLHDRLAEEVAAILRATATTAVWVTHDRSEAEAVADRVVELGALAPSPARAASGTPTVVELGAEETYPLRRRVLRSGTATDAVELDGDDLPGTVHLGVRIGGELVAISTWIERRYPDAPSRAGYQLRGMATTPDRRGTGLGSVLLDAGIDRCRAAGAELVWARARDSALDFYVRHGFRTIGPGYVDPATGLAHHDVVRELD